MLLGNKSPGLYQKHQVFEEVEVGHELFWANHKSLDQNEINQVEFSPLIK